MINLEQLKASVTASWAADSAFGANEWSQANPARGQCVATALVVQHYLGGELQKLTTIFMGQPESHYRNILSDGTVLDLTCQQYPNEQKLTVAPVDLKGFSSIREKRLHDPTTRRKYELLLKRVERSLATT